MDMECAAEVEDDVFFADLSKRISLLIMEDEEEFPVECPTAVSIQAYSQVSQPLYAPSPFFYEPAHKRETQKGTGVFIPRSALPRRKSRSGRSKQSDKTRAAIIPPPSTTTTHSHQSSAYYNIKEK